MEGWKPQSHHHRKMETTQEGGNHSQYRRVETMVSSWEDGNQSHHGKVETTLESPWEGGNHTVTMGRWKPQSHHRKMETTESPW